MINALSWTEAKVLLDSCAGLHDSTIIDVSFDSASLSLVLHLADVYEHTAESGFRILFKRMRLEMSEAIVDATCGLELFEGFDVAQAEYVEHFLKIWTNAGSLEVKYDLIRAEAS